MGGDIPLPYLDGNFSLGANSVASLLGERLVINTPARGTPPLQLTMGDMMERTPGEYLLSGSDEEEDGPFNSMETCVLNDREESFCESYYTLNGPK